MNEKFWTVLKIGAAVGATLLVYEFLNSGPSNELDNFSLIDSSIEKLGEILSASIEDNETRREANLEFKVFSELIMDGEITPDEIENIASSILNMRMNDESEITKTTKTIIRALKRARATSSFVDESTEELELKLDSIAVKINNLSAFQEDYYRKFLLSDNLADLKHPPQVPGIDKPEKAEVVLDFVPVVALPKVPLPAKLRERSKIVVIGETFVDVPAIQISERLNLIIDYSDLNQEDSLTIILFHKKMDELKSMNSLPNGDSGGEK